VENVSIIVYARYGIATQLFYDVASAKMGCTAYELD
jgi:hypothetical protein